MAKGKLAQPPTILDCLVQALSARGDAAEPGWPTLSFKQMAAHASRLRGYTVSSDTIRGVVYNNSTLFERARTTDGQLLWRLSITARALVKK